jgi:hypothetical protein
LENGQADALWRVVTIVHAALSTMKPTESDVEWRRAFGQQTGHFIRLALAEAAERKTIKQREEDP